MMLQYGIDLGFVNFQGLDIITVSTGLIPPDPLGFNHTKTEPYQISVQ